MNTEQAIEANREIMEGDIETVRRNPDLNDAAKKRRIGEIYDKAVAEHKELVEAEDQRVAGELQRATRAALAPPEISGADKAMVAMSYRDALDRVEGVRDSDSLLQVLERAQKTGDEVLGKAVLYRGYELESESVVGAYVKTFPREASKYETFMRAAAAANKQEHQRMLFGTLPPRKPRELERLVMGEGVGR